RQLDDDARASVSARVVNPGAAVMEHREFTDHGEPDAAPGDRRAAVALEPPEAIPHVLPVRAGDARPSVFHPQPGGAAPARPAPPVVARRADADLLTRGAILHRVVE